MTVFLCRSLRLRMNIAGANNRVVSRENSSLDHGSSYPGTGSWRVHVWFVVQLSQSRTNVFLWFVLGPNIIGNRSGPNNEQSTKIELVVDLVVAHGSTAQTGPLQAQKRSKGK